MSAKRVGGEYTYIYGYPRKKVEHWNRCGQNQLLIGFQPVPVVEKTVEQGGTNGQKSGTRRKNDEISGSNCWH